MGQRGGKSCKWKWKGEIKGKGEGGRGVWSENPEKMINRGKGK